MGRMEGREQEKGHCSTLSNPSWINCSRELITPKLFVVAAGDILQDSLGMFSIPYKCLGAAEKVTALPARGDRQTAAQTASSLSRNLGKRADPEADPMAQQCGEEGNSCVTADPAFFSCWL